MMDHQEYLKSGGDKAKKKDLVPAKSRRKAVIDYVVKQALAARGDTSSELNESKKPKYTSMMALEGSENTYNSLFALMARLDDEEEDAVTHLTIKQNLNDYTPKKLRKLANILIDSLCDLTIKKDLLEDKV